MNRIVIFLFAALTVVVFSSCSDSSSPTTSGNVGGTADYGGATFPKKGSTYNFHYFTTDSVGNEVPGSAKDYTATVSLDSQTYMGKSKAYQVSDNGQNNYYTFEHNGDADLFLDQSVFGFFGAFLGNALNQWFTFPTAAHLKGYIIFDTTLKIPLLGDVALFGRTLYIGQESVTVGSETFTADHCWLKISSTIINYEEEFWFVKKIGYFVHRKSKTSLLSIPGLGLGTTTGDEQILTSYSLK
jgi:hypothetical protein